LGRCSTGAASRAGTASAASCHTPRISADGCFFGGGCADAEHGSETGRELRRAAARLARSAELEGVCSERGSATLPMAATIGMAIGAGGVACGEQLSYRRNAKRRFT
jgi:hypothetical protein